MKNSVATSLLASALFGGHAYAVEREGAAKDAWIDGKLEAVYALNRHLSAFAIETEVDEGIVHLTGNVQQDIDRDLAGELAKNIDGVVDVSNELVVVADARSPSPEAEGRSFARWIDDATTTASVKSKLLSNPNTAGMRIGVETRGEVVTLSGQVASAEERDLAEELTRNTGDVETVRNQLTVGSAL
jgi:hyperosmotically inducible protein